MDDLIKRLIKRKVGYGTFSITTHYDGHTIGCLTNNTLAIDAAFDEDYDMEHNHDRIYETRKEAQESLIYEILNKNDI